MREAAQTDWEAIEAAYRAGVLSLREVARQHSLAVSTLHKRVRAKGWRRDLSSAVRQEAQSRLARELAPPGDPEEQERGDRKIVDAAAVTQVEVVRQHRNTLSRSREHRWLHSAQSTHGRRAGDARYTRKSTEHNLDLEFKYDGWDRAAGDSGRQRRGCLRHY